MKPQPHHHFAAVLSFAPTLLRWAVVVLTFAGATTLRALDLPPPYTVNLPFEADQATPIWLGHPEAPQNAFATLNLPIQPPDPAASLLVTVFFQEKEGGFLRISWQGAQNGQMLSDNFYEGIAMSNQRSLLISPETMRDSGVLNFQCSGATLGIQRIKLEWLENHPGLVSSELRDILVTPAVGATQPAPALNGQPKPVDPAAWHDQIVTVPITETPERIEGGVEYSVQMDDAPGLARLALKEAGLPWGQHIVVWINQKRAGIISPAVPDLLDAGFFPGSDLSASYVGWRDGSAYVPVNWLKVGVNAVSFSAEEDAPDGNSNDPSTGALAPLAIKNVILQLYYPPPPSIPAPSSSTPLGDVPPPSAATADSSAPSPLLPPPTVSPPPETTNTP